MIIKVNYTVSDVYMSTSISPVYIKVVYSGVSAGGGGTWGTITGTLSAQTDLQDALDDKVPYTGATGAVNLGAFGITAASIIKSGGTSSQFLKADGSVDSSTYVGGTGVANQLTYWNGTGSVTGSAGLVYNDGTGAMTLSKNQNARTSIEITNTTSGTTGNAALLLTSDVLSGQGSLNKYSNTTTAYKIAQSSDLILFNSTKGDLTFLNDFATGKIKWGAGGASTAQATLTAAGRLLLGTTSESTFLLDVNGTARVSGEFRMKSNQMTWGNDFVSNSILLYAGASSTDRIGIGVTASGGLGLFSRVNSLWLSATNDAATMSASNAQIQITNTKIEGIVPFVKNTVGNAFIYDSGVTTNRYGIGIIGFNDGTAIFSGNLNPSILFGIGFDGTNMTKSTATMWMSATSLHIGTNTELASSILTLNSTTKGFLPPRMTTAQRDAIASPATGLQVYNTTTLANNTYNGTAWLSEVNLTSAGRLLLGGAVESTFLLDVNGTARITGAINGVSISSRLGTQSIFIGVDAGASSTASVNFNTIIGHTSAYSLTTGNYNTMIGRQNAILSTTINNSILIGANNLIQYTGTILDVLSFGVGSSTLVSYPIFATNIKDASPSFRIGGNNDLALSAFPSVTVSAILDLTSTTKGFLPPRMTTTQINAIATPVNGLMAYNTTIDHMCVYQAGAWVKLNHSPM